MPTPFPAFQLPLQAEDDEPLVDVNALWHALYDRAGYDLRITYRMEPIPPFAQDDEAWIDALLCHANLR